MGPEKSIRRYGLDACAEDRHSCLSGSEDPGSLKGSIDVPEIAMNRRTHEEMQQRKRDYSSEWRGQLKGKCPIHDRFTGIGSESPGIFT